MSYHRYWNKSFIIFIFQTVDDGYTQSTHSAPALMSNPKLYPYEELKVTSKKRLPSDVDRDHLEVCFFIL